MSRYQLAQLNIGIATAPLDSDVMADFMNNLDRINALAESSPGFVWRLKADDGNATSLRPIDDKTLVNMSVWTDAQSLSAFVFRSGHVEFMRRRREWFERMPEAYLVLWWVPEGHIPSTDEAVARLTHLRKHGATPHAFNFRSVFPPPDAAQADTPAAIDDACPAT
jgi:Domain of unknown function (DUF3291)